MTTRTVTVQQETEEEVVICDECGLGEDAGEIVTYKVSQVDSKNVENVRDYDPLDLHEGCLEDMGVDVPDHLEYRQQVEKDTEFMNTPIVALDKFGVSMVGFIAAGTFMIGNFGVSHWGFLGVLIAVLGSMMALHRGWYAARKP